MDLNDVLARQISERLDRASFKGVSRLTDHETVLVFENSEGTFELSVHGEGGVTVSLRARHDQVGIGRYPR